MRVSYHKHLSNKGPGSPECLGRDPHGLPLLLLLLAPCGHARLRLVVRCAGLLLLPALCCRCMQKCALQAAVPIEASARLAQHTPEEAKRYASNSSYEMSDVTAAPLTLVQTLLPRPTPAHLLSPCCRCC
jgi:hypothetical protein